MKQVVDANFLRSPLLERYLRPSAANLVVLTDYSCMESYKGDSIVNLSESLEIVSRYPAQVIMLRDTRQIIKLGPSANSAALIDQEQTVGFQRFCLCVSLAAQGNSELESQIRANGRLANGHFLQVRADAPKMAQSVVDEAASLDPAIVKQLRSGESLGADSCEVVIRQILLLAAILLRDHPDAGQLPKWPEVRDTFIFRYALAFYLLTLRWISDSGIQNATPERLVNDKVDMALVAYATFFDGVLSRDKKLLAIYEDTSFFLREVFVSDLKESR